MARYTRPTDDIQVIASKHGRPGVLVPPVAAELPPTTFFPLAPAPIPRRRPVPFAPDTLLPSPMAPVTRPVVSYGNATGAPLVQVQAREIAPSEVQLRVQSNRVYAILIAVFVMVGTAVVIANSVVITPDPIVSPPAPSPGLRTVVIEDEELGAAEEEEAAPPPAPPPAPPRARVSAARPATAPSGPSPLTVRLADPTQAVSFEVNCPSGFRQRASFVGGSGTLADVPNETCRLIFHGGAPLSYGPVHGGQSLGCSFSGTTAVCR